MRPLLFDIIGESLRRLVIVNTTIGNTLIRGLVFVFNAINALLNTAGVGLLRLVDKKRFEYHAALAYQAGELGEFALMAEATRVRDNAVQEKVWTYAHTAAMNRIADALHRQCGWQPEQIHAYLKEVIEAIPGVTYYGA